MSSQNGTHNVNASVPCRVLLLLLALPAVAGPIPSDYRQRPPPAPNSTLDDARDKHRAGQLDEALSLYTEVAASDTAPVHRATALNNSCVILTNRGELSAAEALCKQALSARKRTRDWLSLARTLNNLARVEARLGRVDRARLRYGTTIELYAQTNNIQGQVIGLVNLGVLETNTRHYAAALEKYNRAESLIKRAEDPPWAAYQRVLLQLNTSVVLEQIGAYDEALVQLDLAMAAAPTAAPALLSDIQLNRGVVLRNLGDPAAALAAYDAALASFEQRGDQVAVANVYLNQALVQWLDQSDIETALARLDQARALSETSGDVGATREAQYFSLRARLDRGDVDQAATLLTELNDETDDWFFRDARARVAFARGDSTLALDAALSAIAYIEDQRAALVQDTHRQTLLTDRRAAYALAVNILHERYERSASIDVARQALDIVGRAKALALIEATGRMPTLVVKKNLTKTISGPLLEFFVTQQNTDAWTVRADTILWRRFDSAPLQRAATQLHSALSRAEKLPAESMSVLLPLIGELDFSRTELVVAPDGALTLIPFDLLIAQQMGGRTSPIAVRYSATATPLVPQFDNSAPRLFALAHAAVDSDTVDHPALRVLPPLPRVNAEVTQIATYFDGKAQVVTDSAASEVALRNFRATPGDVLHIASHAVLDSRLDDGAVLVLGGSADEDGLLYPRDVAALDLPVALTVLSACSTAAGEGTVGTPMTNLTGAFMAAGSRAVLATLWPVDDAASAVVMDQFYAHLARGLSPNDALQATKRRLAESKDWSAPSVWAGYVIYGESGPIIHQPGNTRWFALLAMPLLGALFVIGWWRRVR